MYIKKLPFSYKPCVKNTFSGQLNSAQKVFHSMEMYSVISNFDLLLLLCGKMNFACGNHKQ